MITMQQALDDVSWLGRVVKIHSIGRYDIVEYKRRLDGAPASWSVHPSYTVFLDGKKTSYGASSIEEALLIGMAVAFDYENASNMAVASTYAARVLNLPGRPK